MNYQLVIQLEGAEKADAALDNLIKKTGQLSSAPKVSFDEFLNAGSEAEGVDSGKTFAKGFGKGAMSLKPIVGDWMKAVFKGTVLDPNKFWNDAIKHGKPESIGKMQGPDLFGDLRMADSERRQKQLLKQVMGMGDISQFDQKKVDWKKILLGGSLGISNPYIGARLISDEMGKGQGGVAGGIFGKGGIMGFSEIFAAFKIFKFSIDLFKMGVEKFMQAAERARQFYAKSLQSGLGSNFTIQRSVLASVLGVSEQEVLRFGAALNYLNPKLAFAIGQLQESQGTLATSGVQIKILGENLKAMITQIAGGLSPAVSAAIINLNNFIAVVGQAKIFSVIGSMIGSLIQKLSNFYGAIELVVGGLISGITLVFLQFKIMLKMMANAFVDLFPKLSAIFGIGHQDVSGDVAQQGKVKTAFEMQFADFIKNLSGAGKNSQLPEPSSAMSRLPVSSFEKMGLVVGQGSNSTNDLIKKSNGYLKTIAEIVKGNAQQGRNRFGMSPATNNP